MMESEKKKRRRREGSLLRRVNDRLVTQVLKMARSESRVNNTNKVFFLLYIYIYMILDVYIYICTYV